MRPNRNVISGGTSIFAYRSELIFIFLIDFFKIPYKISAPYCPTRNRIQGFLQPLNGDSLFIIKSYNYLPIQPILVYSKAPNQINLLLAESYGSCIGADQDWSH
jgi:hypothetical protein